MKKEYIDLIKEIPWLQVRSYKGELLDECWLADVDKGWRDIALETFKKIDEILKKNPEERAAYQLEQVKEKWGMLRIYDNSGNSEIQDLLLELENESWKHCIDCGKKSEYSSTGWVCPYCKDCRDRIIEKAKREGYEPGEFKPIDDRGWKKVSIAELKQRFNEMMEADDESHDVSR